MGEKFVRAQRFYLIPLLLLAFLISPCIANAQEEAGDALDGITPAVSDNNIQPTSDNNIQPTSDNITPAATNAILVAAPGDFWTNEIYYEPWGGNDVCARWWIGDNAGTIHIPSTVYANGSTWTVTSIGNQAATWKDGVTSIIIDEGIKHIGWVSFIGASSITSLNVPASVTSFGLNPDGTGSGGAFANCNSLQTLICGPVLGSAEFSMDSDDSVLSSVTIRDGATSIPRYCFSVSNNVANALVSLHIPETVTSIGEFAFHGRSNLKTINIPSGVTSIDAFAFEDCGITSITIPDNLSYLGEHAFDDCKSLSGDIVIPGTLETVPYMAFAGTSLNNVTLEPGVVNLGEYAFSSRISGTFTFPDTIRSINNPDGIPRASSYTLTITGDTKIQDSKSFTPQGSSKVSIGYTINKYLLFWDATIRNETASALTVTLPDGKQVAVNPGKSYTATHRPQWFQLGGEGRFDTMKKITETSFSAGSTDTVILATGNDFPDALAASGLAGIKDAPILLTNSDSIPTQTKQEIGRIGATKAIIVGGTGVISPAVEKELASLLGKNGTVLRAAGEDRFGTARDIYEKGTGSWGRTAILATGESFADALSISSYAYANAYPIFLTPPDSLEAATSSLLTKASFDKIIIVGGEGVVSPGIQNVLTSRFGSANVERLGGNDRYDTSILIANWLAKNGMSYDGMALATGLDFPDALSGAALCGQNSSILLLLDLGEDDCMSRSITPNADKIQTGYFLGGDGVIGPFMQYKVRSLF